MEVCVLKTLKMGLGFWDHRLPWSVSKPADSS